MSKRQVWAVALLAGAMPFAVANAQPEAGEYEVLISGSGSSDNDFDTTVFGVTGSFGKFFTDNVLLGIRQSVNVADTTSGSSFNGVTRGFADYHFDLGQLQPYVGASAGAVYGEDVNDTLIAGLDAGIKYYVLETTFIALQGEYQFTFEDTDDADEAFSDGGFLYSVGIGYNF